MDNLDYMSTSDQMVEMENATKAELQRVTSELAEARKQLSEQANTHKELHKKLIYLLGVAYKERDEARNQAQKLLATQPYAQKLLASSSTKEHQQRLQGMDSIGRITLPREVDFQGKRPSLVPYIIQNSSINNKFYNSNVNNIVTNGNPNITKYSELPSSSTSCSLISEGNDTDCVTPSNDQTLALYDHIAKARALPEKGKLLETVQQASTLVDSIMMGAPAPQWQNQPQMLPNFDVSQTSMDVNKRLRYI